jgi:LPS sulfotransferase NodH
MNAVDRHSVSFDLPAARVRKLDYCIASTPHSGSKLLSEALWESGSAGAPGEYFKRGPMGSFANRWSVGTIDAYVRALRKHRTTRGGVFAFSANYHQFEDQIGADLMESHFAAIRPIFFRRRDVLGQAVAWAQAAQLDPNRPAEEREDSPRFDAEQIEKLVDQIFFEEQGWRDYFDSISTNPHEVFYEDLMADFEGTVRRAFEFLGLEAPEQIECPPRLGALSQTSQLWTWRFRKSAGQPSRPAAAPATSSQKVVALPPPIQLQTWRAERQA